eukprot:1199582-Prymnesium_polylepis.1
MSSSGHSSRSAGKQPRDGNGPFAGGGKQPRADRAGAGGKGPPQRGSQVHCDVVEWLKKKKLDVPTALQSARLHGGGSGAMDAATRSREVTQVLALLPGLRERERRALARYVEQREKQRLEAAAPSPAPVVSSDDEDAAAPIGPPPVAGGAWPAGV